MNQGRIWCVVNPTVGLPLFLGGVTAIALLVHTSVLTNTNWMARYWQGAERPRAALPTDAKPVAQVLPGTGVAITVAPAPGKADTFVITVVPAPGAPVMAAVDDLVPKATALK